MRIVTMLFFVFILGQTSLVRAQEGILSFIPRDEHNNVWCIHDAKSKAIR